MRKALSTLVALAMLGGALVVAANAQDYRRGRGDAAFSPATASELAAADRRLNQMYQRRIADARADDRRDRRGRGWYGQEDALRSSERAWIAFRDAECRYLTQQDLRSRMHDGLVRGCLLQHTEERTDALRDAEAVLASR